MTDPQSTVALMPVGPIPGQWATASPFAGADVCQAVGWDVLPGGVRPCFDDDFWDLSGVRDIPKSVRPNVRRLDFRGISNPAFRLTAKEFIFARAAPGHERVLALPRAYRFPYKPASCFNLCTQVVRWLNFLSEQGVSNLANVLQEHCDVYRDIRSQRVTRKIGSGPIKPGTMKTIIYAVKDLASYTELFTAAAYRPDFMPWHGHTVAEVAGWKYSAQEQVPPVPEEVLQPTVAATLYLVETIGPLAAVEFEKWLDDHRDPNSATLRNFSPNTRRKLAAVLNSYVRGHQPLPQLNDGQVTKRIRRGWNPSDRLIAVDIGRLLNEQTNYASVPDHAVDAVRPMLETALDKVGLAGIFGRQAALVPRYDDNEQLVPFTEPLTGHQLRGLVFVVLAACRILVAAISGMRASELEELTPDSPQPPTTVSGDTQRFKLASKLIKKQPLGGVRDEWVVLEPAYRAVQLASRLIGSEAEGRVFPRSQTSFMHNRLRDWVNGPRGRRLGLAPIPPGPVNGRMLRRTVAVELAFRPGGLLAAKIHLKHVSVVTTEGYAQRPGGAQGMLLAEIEREQQAHHLEVTSQAFREYQAGRLPVGPGARDLIKAFAQIEDVLADQDPGTASVLDNERRLEMILRQHASTLHLQTANYCWFRDPAKALCLKLAGTPHATKPLAGMCDSARCPQATHHPCHLPVWRSAEATNKAFLENPRVTKGEKARLSSELERAQAVVAEIIAAAEQE